MKVPDLPSERTIKGPILCTYLNIGVKYFLMHFVLESSLLPLHGGVINLETVVVQQAHLHKYLPADNNTVLYP